MLSALHTLAPEHRDQAVAQYRAAGVDLGHVSGGRTNDGFLLKRLIVEHPERSVRQQSINRRRVLRHSDEDDVPVAKHGFGNDGAGKVCAFAPAAAMVRTTSAAPIASPNRVKN